MTEFEPPSFLCQKLFETRHDYVFSDQNSGLHEYISVAFQLGASHPDLWRSSNHPSQVQTEIEQMGYHLAA